MSSDVPAEQQCAAPGCEQRATDGRARGGLCNEHVPGSDDGDESETPESTDERAAEAGSGDANPTPDGPETGSLDDARAIARDEYPTLPDGTPWLTWKPKTNGQKVPRAPWHTGGDAFTSAQDAEVWTDRETAAKWCEHLPGYDLAVNIRDRDDHPEETLVLIDYDDARDPETGRVHPTVREHVERAGSYADVSTSGTGVHILVRGALPDGVKAIDASLPADPEGELEADIEVYDSGRFIAMTGDHLAETPIDVTGAQAFVDELADEFATVAEGTPDELVTDPEKTREQLADVETTSDIQDVFDAIQHTGPRDIRLRSSVTQERAAGSKSLDPAYRESESGTGLAQVGDGWIDRKGMHGLGALQLVALEERIISRPDEYPAGEEFWRAVEALRERGAHIPEFDAPDETEPVAVLPNSPRAQASANGWAWRNADRAGVEDALTVDDARDRTTSAIADAYRSSGNVLLEALPTLGKSYGAVAAAAETGEPVSILTGRGNEEQYEQFREWCEARDLRAKVLPSVRRDCETFTGEHGDEIADQVRQWYERGATGKEIHRDAEYELGAPLPCEGPAGARCSYKAGWQFDAEEYDVLIGHYLHANVQSVTSGRTVVLDESPDGAFETVLGDAHLAGAVSLYLQQTSGLPFDDYADLLENRTDPERRAEALAYFDDRAVERDAAQAFTSKGHALAPVATYTILAGAESDLENGWERAQLPEDYGHVGLFDRESGYVHLLTPPELSYTRGVVGLDGTPTPRMWELALGTRLDHRHVLDVDERREYLRDGLGLNIIRTTDAVKPYSGTTDHVAVGQDHALLEAITDEHDKQPALLTTCTAEKAYRAGEEPVLDDVASHAHYGNLKGSNEYASTRLGAVIGSRHFGDGFVQKWGAYAGEAVERGDGRGAELTYTGVGEHIHQHMTEHETLQAVMRFGRDGGGATVYVHTNTLPDWVPLAGAPPESGNCVIRTRSDGERAVIEAARDLAGPHREGWTTDDVAEHPAVDVSDRQVRTHLSRLVEEGYLSTRPHPDDGRRQQWCDENMADVQQRGETEIDGGDGDRDEHDDGSDGDDASEVAEVPRTILYTWDFRKISPDQASTDPAGGAERGAVRTDGGREQPPDETPGDGGGGE